MFSLYYLFLITVTVRMSNRYFLSLSLVHRNCPLSFVGPTAGYQCQCEDLHELSREVVRDATKEVSMCFHVGRTWKG